MTDNKTITLSQQDAEEILRLLEFAEYGLLSENDKEMLDFRLSATKLRESLSDSKKSKMTVRELMKVMAPADEFQVNYQSESDSCTQCFDVQLSRSEVIAKYGNRTIDLVMDGSRVDQEGFQVGGDAGALTIVLDY